ncbi:AAA family ATPase (plasmid) [Methanocaldococcus sp. 16A]
MARENIKNEIINILRSKPNYTSDWDSIYKLLTENGYNASSVSHAKRVLIDERILEEFKRDGVKYVRLIEPQMMHFNEEFFDTYREIIVNYFCEIHKEDIIKDVERVEIDLANLYEYCVVIGLDLDFIEWIINHPEEALKFFKECYEEAFYKLNNENPKDLRVLTFKNLPKPYKVIETPFGERPFTIEDIKSKIVGKLVEFEGVITVATKIISMLKKGVFICPKCGSKIIKEYNNIFEPFSAPKCCENECMLLEDESEFIDVQEFKLQQPLDLMEKPEEPPRYITVIYENTPGIYAGRVRVVGIPFNVRMKKNSLGFNIYVKATHIEVIDNDTHIDLTPEDIEKIEKLAKRKDVIDVLSNKFFDRIKGHDMVKKAIFLQQIKGVPAEGERHNIHILLITDPGVGKTVMMRKVAQIPGNEYTSMTSTTGVGLTTAVVREKVALGSESWVIKPGVLVRANGGTACIDEISVKKDSLSDILEAMEQQTIHVNKGGISAKLKAETAILAACNPKRGRFDRNLTVIEQIDIPAPLLSRFDLIFPLMDIPEKGKDKEIAKHILMQKKKKVLGEENKLVLDGIEIDDEFIIKYILYARQKKPVISDEAIELISNYYEEMRNNSNTISITARQLEALLRLSEAIAKAKLKDIVDEEDAKEAIDLVDYCLKEIAYDPETGNIDIDKIAGTPKSRRDKMDAVLNIIREIAELRNDGLAPEEEIYEKAKSIGLSEKDVENALEYLKKAGDIYSPKSGYWGIM